MKLHFFYFLLNFSYRNFMENWDQWGQKETDGKHPTLQRGEAGQHGAFWTLMTRAELRTLILYWIDYCPVKEEVFGTLRSVETHTTQMPGWTERNLFSSVLSCRERGQGTSAYTKLQEMLLLSETSERSRKWNAWHVTQGFGWFYGSRKSMLIKYHPSSGCCPSSSYSPTTDKRNPAAPMVISRVITCQSCLPTAFCKPPFPKRPSASVSVKFLTHRSSSRLPKQGTWQRI